jgi:GT2 family glycosyltransferase
MIGPAAARHLHGANPSMQPTSAESTKAMAEPMIAAPPLVCVVVLTWNDTSMTRICLRHVFASTYANMRVILVDNGSREPCGRTLKAEFPGVELIEIPQNKGFAGGGNVGLTRAMALDPKYVLHLNNDAFVQPTAIERLVRTMEADGTIGIAHALLLYPNEERVQFYRATLDRDLAWHDHHHVGEMLSSREWPTVDSAFVPACVIMYRAEALQRVGLYDETFGTSWEDFDICLRFTDAGWRIVAVGDARSEHRSHQTTGASSPYIIYHMTRNRLICIGRYANRLEFLRRFPRIARTFYWGVREYGFTNWSAHKSFVLGVWDFLRGNLGERSRFTTVDRSVRSKTSDPIPRNAPD